MPADYKIDKERGLVMSFGSGALTIQDILEHQERLKKDPDFDPSYSQIFDLDLVERIEITPADVRRAAAKNIFSPKSHRSVLVKSDLQYGLARMFEMHRDSAGEVGIRVFRNPDEALDWALSNESSAKGISGKAS